MEKQVPEITTTIKCAFIIFRELSRTTRQPHEKKMVPNKKEVKMAVLKQHDDIEENRVEVLLGDDNIADESNESVTFLGA
jgi:hypothetical protein